MNLVEKIYIETIEEIVEIEDRDKSGYCIRTNQQKITLLIDNFQSCCESFGYFMSEDNLEQFIGSKLLGITLTNTALKTHEFEKHDPGDLDAGGIMFVNINTNVGLLQFAAYNAHNGDYGHIAEVTSTQLTHNECL